MGVIRGDGSLSMTKRGKGGYHYTFRIISGVEDHLIYLNKIFKKNFEIIGHLIKDRRKEKTYYLVFKNVIIFFYFVLLGSQIGKKTHGKLPSILNDKIYKLNYLAGLVDTDGSISPSGNRIQLKQKSLELLKGIKIMCDELNLNCSAPKVNYTNFKPYYYIRFDNKLPLRLKTNKFLKH